MITILQALRIGRIGTGYTLITGVGYVSIAVLSPALEVGGPALLAPLIIISSLFQFVIGARLSMLRRIMTPVVTGTVLLLIAITTMTLAFDMIADPPEGTSSTPGPAVRGRDPGDDRGGRAAHFRLPAAVGDDSRDSRGLGGRRTARHL